MEHPQFIESEEEDDGFEVINPFNINFEEFYKVKDRPDFFHFKIHRPEELEEEMQTVVENDAYLSRSKPIDFFGKAIAQSAEKIEDYERQSGFDKETFEYKDFVNLHQPKHGITEGGKGLTFYTKPVINHTCLMSNILNIIISHGCSSLCSFCKESCLSRGFTQTDIKTPTGILKVNIEGEEVEIPGQAKVKFYDTENKIMIYGPIEIPLHKNFPISISSLRKIKDRELFRVLAE